MMKKQDTTGKSLLAQELHHSIKTWPVDDRPREKLFKSGEHTLSNTELLAILLRNGTRGQSAVDMARALLKKFKSFRNMSHTDARDWREFKGMGKAKIAQIKAALEIARRFNAPEETDKKPVIKFTEDLVKMFQSRMRDLKVEVVKVALLDASHRVIDVVEVSQGTPSGANPVIREIISVALQNFASAIVCIHNHPSGDASPSREDEKFTAELKQAARLMDIELLDHIIFGGDSFYSFDKNGVQSYE